MQTIVECQRSWGIENILYGHADDMSYFLVEKSKRLDNHLSQLESNAW